MSYLWTLIAQQIILALSPKANQCGIITKPLSWPIKIMQKGPQKNTNKQNMTQCNSIRVPVKWQKNSLVEICWSNIRYGPLNEASIKKNTASIR